MSELPKAFSCGECGGAVPLVTVATGIRVMCPSCGHANVITDDLLTKLMAGHGVRSSNELPATMPAPNLPPSDDEPTKLRGRRTEKMTADSISQWKPAAIEPPEPERMPNAGMFSGNPHVAPPPAPRTPNPAFAPPSPNPGFAPSPIPSPMPTGAPTNYGAPVAPGMGGMPGVPGTPGFGVHTQMRKSQMLWSAVAESESRGRRFAILTCIPYSAGATLLGVGLLVISAMAASATNAAMNNPAGPGAPANNPAAQLGPLMMLGAFVNLSLVSVGIILHAIGTLTASIFARGLVRGLLLFCLGSAPLLIMLVMGGYAVFFNATTLIVSLSLPATVAVYGAGAASREFTDTPWVVNTAALAGILQVGIILYMAVGVNEQFKGTPFGLMMANFMIYIVLLFGAPPAIAAYNYFAKSENFARAIPIAYWVCYVFLFTFFNLMITGSLQTALGVFLGLSASIGWLFVAGAGLRDMLVYQAYQMRGGKKGMAIGQQFAVPAAPTGPPMPGGNFGPMGGYNPVSSYDPHGYQTPASSADPYAPSAPPINGYSSDSQSADDSAPPPWTR